MKILMVNKFLYRRGGSETYCFALSEALRRCGHEVIFFAMQNDKNLPCEQEKYFVKNIDYRSSKNKVEKIKQFFKLIYSFEAKRNFEKLVLDEKPDVVHMNLVHRQITLSIVDVCEKYKIPVVYTTHDLVCSCPVGSLLTWNREKCRRCYKGHFYNCIKNNCIKGSKLKSWAAYLEAEFYKMHHSYDKIGAFITPSEFYKKEIINSCITNSNIYHMKNLLPIGTKYNRCCAKEKYFLFLGSLTKNKGAYTLANAFANANLEGWKLLFAGDGEEMTRIRQYVNKNDLNNRIKLLGFIKGNELEEIVNKAYAIVLPSEWFENGPYALMEPMAKGKPVIGADIGGIPELAIPGKTGWLFESGNVEELKDTLMKAASIDEKEYDRLAEGAVNFARENFDAEKYVQKLVKIYESLLKED